MAARPESASPGKRPRTATSKDELEQYGVWVKAEPQDIATEPESLSDQDTDFSLPDLDEPRQEESFLTEEEERLLGSFDDIETEAAPAAEDRLPEVDADFSSLPDIEDFELPGSTGSTSSRRAPASASPDLDLRIEDLPAGFKEPSFTVSTELDPSSIEGLDAASEDFAQSAEPDGLPSTEDFSFDEDELSLDLDEPEQAPAARSSAAGSHAIEDVSADFLDEGSAPLGKARAKTEDKTRGNRAADVTEEFLLDEVSESGAAAVNEEAEFEPLDIDLHFEDSTGSGKSAQVAEAGFEEIGDLDSYLSESDEMEPPAFDDLAALERELSSDPETRRLGEPAEAIPVAASSPEPSMANELLLKIANELSSIRSELVALKSQMGAPRSEPAQGAAEAAQAAEEEAETVSGGFFDEEDDEKIALTGDELDNILSSADFTEEPAPVIEGESLTLDLDGEAAPPVAAEVAESAPEIDLSEFGMDSTELGGGNLLPEDGDYSAALPKPEEPVLRVSLEEDSGLGQEGTPPFLDEEPAESDETLLKLAQEGIAPITDAPKDTSYLEEPLAAEDALDLGENPFVEAPLVEPDLSELTVDLPLGADDLDLAGDLALEQADEVLPDMALDIDASQSLDATDAELLDAGFDEQPLPEVEESEYEEISLAAEEATADEGAASESADDFVEFLDEGLPEEEVLHHESKDLPPLPESDFEEENLVEATESLDESLFVSSARAPEPAEPPSKPRPAPAPIEPEEISEEMAEEPLSPPQPTAAAKTPEARQPAAKPAPSQPAPAASLDPNEKLKSEIRSVLTYLDRLLQALPEDKIEEFAQSEHYDTYKQLFEDLGLA